MSRARLLQIIGLIILGIAIGRCGSGVGEPKTVYVTKPAPPAETQVVVRPSLPADCRRAIDMAVTIRDNAGALDTASGPQIDLIGDAQVAIASGDTKLLNDVATRQRELTRKTSDAAEVLQREMSTYSYVLGKCQEALK